MGSETGKKRDRLRPGDVVEVRPAAEILATLDEGGATEGMPFMPEMLQHVGRRFTVTRRVEKICDTVGKVSGEPSVSRRMRGTVYLDDLRCDGSAHGGCQAGCRLYWKEEWLVPVDGEHPRRLDEPTELAALAEVAQASTLTVREVGGQQAEAWRCQATEARIASEPLGALDPRQHLREIAVGNVPARRVVAVLGRAALARLIIRARIVVSWMLRTLRLRSPRPDLVASAPSATPTPARSSQRIEPGDVVRIKPREEILRTLNNRWRHRGLYYDDAEMSAYCGGTYIVKDRVERIIDDATGEMLEMKNDCLILEGVCCTGERSSRRWFCPRGIYPFWREDWVELVERGAKPKELGVIRR